MAKFSECLGNVMVLVFCLSVSAHCCKWESSEDGKSGKSEEFNNRLYCRLRTLQPVEWDTQLAYVNSARLERTTSVDIECSDVLFFESALEMDTFQRLPRLRELSISSCKVREVQAGALAAVPDLKKLSIRTHNTEWPAMALTLSADSFSGMRELRHLDLSDNSFLSVPANLFCSLSSLQHLNLSSNRLQDVSALGFSSQCLDELTTLDLSWNNIAAVPAGSLSGLGKLQNLLLQHNGLVDIADQALAQLESLRFFNLSNNQLAVLPPELFRDCRELRELDLHNNSLSVLPPGLFAGLTQLQVLDLSENSLGSAAVHRDTFPGLVRLVVLNLAYNALSRVDGQIFRDLASLQVLRLDHNSVETIDPDAFVPLYNLHTLDLSHNRLVSLSDRLMGGLFVLSSLSLGYNQISVISNHAFRNCTGLRDLDLSGNQLNVIPDAVSELSLLKSLDLSANRIKTLANVSFKGLQQLYSLNLAENSVATLNKDVLQGLENLVALNFAGNKIESIEPNSFDRCPGLQVLRLDNNELIDVNGLFVQLQNLRWLNISANRVQLFDYSFLPRNLEWLDIHQNEISELGNYFQIEAQLGLKALDASYNRLASLSSENLPDSIVELFLNNNWINQITPNTFLKKVNISRVDLNSNRLSTLEPAALWLSPVPIDRDLPEFSLGDNPWECDCGLEWLPPLVQPSSQSRQQPRLVDAADITCRLTFSRNHSNRTERPLVPLVDVRPEQFLCSYETHCFALCHCCDFDACDCEMTCPMGCSCYHDPTWSANIVDCSAAQHSNLPEGIPMDVTELYLDGNNFPEVPSHAFIGRKNLRALFLNSSNVVSLRNRTFHGLGALQILHLENNFIEEVRGSEFEPLEHLRELHLQNNQLRFISDTAFIHLQSLQVLNLNGNRLFNFAMWRLTANPRLHQVALANNPWSCDCRFLTDLQLWVQNNPAKVRDLSELRCFDRDSIQTGGEGLAYADLNATCNNMVATVYARQHVAVVEYLPVMVAAMVVLIILVAGVVIALVYRDIIRVWCYSRYGVRLCEKEDAENGKTKPSLFDAFVCYSLKDEQFVTQVLGAELEHGNHCYRLCLQHRDFPTNSAANHENNGPSVGDPLALGLAASRRVVLAISQSFVESEWTRPELRAALTGFLRQPRQRIITILLSDRVIPEAESDLNLVLKSSYVIRWGEKRFWDKLRYALPNPRSSHYIQNLQAGELWYQPSAPKPSSNGTTLAKKTLPRPQFPHPSFPRRYTSTPQHGPCDNSSPWPVARRELHFPEDSSQSGYSGHSQCYSRLEHSYMSIDHGHEHIYSSVQDPCEYHTRPDCWSYQAAAMNGYDKDFVQHPAVHQNVPAPRPPLLEPNMASFGFDYTGGRARAGTFVV